MTGRVWRLWPAIGLVICLALASFTLLAQELHLKKRTLNTSRVPAAAGGAGYARARLAAGTGGPVVSHQIVQFDHPPGVEELNALMDAGAKIVAMVPDNAVMVLAPAGLSAGGALRWTGILEADDKLSPDLAAAGPMQVVVEFHADVELGAQPAIAAAEGVELVRPPVLLAKHALVTATYEKLLALARHDEVAYIFPADPALLEDGGTIPCAGMLTLSGPVAQYTNIVHGWDVDNDHVAHLNYVFGALTPRVPEATVRAEIVRALAEWSKYANVAFQPGVSASAARTVLVKFASGSHGDSYPFDSKGSVLAHTFYPVPVNFEPVAGDMHLNADEDWHSGGDIDIYSVALHEAGHAIGLGHTDKPGDVMYPYYRRGMVLSAGDIAAAQALYGAASSAAAAPLTVVPAPPQLPLLRLTLDPAPLASSSGSLSMTGTISGGVAPVGIQWQTDHGYSGAAVQVNSVSWSIPGIPLATGENNITLTAFDSAHQTITQTAVVTRLQSTPVAGSAPVSVSITSPSGSVFTTSAATISLAGKAQGGAGVTQVVWQSSGGASGVASGAGPWVAAGVPLLTGTNTIFVRAIDSKGANSWAAVVVVRR